jgi:Zn-finger nucleic acid-binding protein
MITTCPVCREQTLTENQLEADLACLRCSKCNGSWVSVWQYDQWLSLQRENLPEKESDPTITLVSGETAGVRFCPGCNYLLIKYQIGHQVPFTLNRCGHCGGVWFDKNEWEILKSRNLHDDVHLVFSPTWQSAVRREEHKQAIDEILREQLGDDDLKEIQRIKAWLQRHPKSAELYAYLMPDRGAQGAALATRPSR